MKLAQALLPVLELMHPLADLPIIPDADRIEVDAGTRALFLQKLLDLLQ